jgi:hypothetical protein
MSMEEKEKLNNYVAKLKQALDLLFNNLPDHQDDTIMSKTIDIIRDELKNESNRNQSNQPNSVSSTLRCFLLTEIIESPTFKALLVEKDFEIIQIFFDFIGSYVEVFARSDPEFVIKTIDFLSIYMKEHLETHFITFPTVTCSVLNIFSLIYDEVNSTENNELPANTKQGFNGTILDSCMFSESFLHKMLKANCKSLFVRKAFKHLLKKHLAYLIRQKLNNEDTNEERLATLIDNLGQKMPLDIRMHNTDTISDTIELFLFDDNALEASKQFAFLFEFYSKFQFDRLELNELLNCEHLINDASIESLTTILGFGMLSQLYSTESHGKCHFLRVLIRAFS